MCSEVGAAGGCSAMQSQRNVDVWRFSGPEEFRTATSILPSVPGSLPALQSSDKAPAPHPSSSSSVCCARLGMPMGGARSRGMSGPRGHPTRGLEQNTTHTREGEGR